MFPFLPTSIITNWKTHTFLGKKHLIKNIQWKPNVGSRNPQNLGVPKLKFEKLALPKTKRNRREIKYDNKIIYNIVNGNKIHQRLRARKLKPDHHGYNILCVLLSVHIFE